MAIVLILVVVLVAGGGAAAYFLKAKGADGGSGASTTSSTSAPSARTTSRPTVAPASVPAEPAAPSVRPAAPAASEVSPPASRGVTPGTPRSGRPAPTPPAAEVPAPAEPDDEPEEIESDEDIKLSRFGLKPERPLDPKTAALLSEPMVPTGRVYDMELTDSSSTESPATAELPVEVDAVEVEPVEVEPVEVEPVEVQASATAPEPVGADVAREQEPAPAPVEPAVEAEVAARPTPEPVVAAVPEAPVVTEPEPEPTAEPIAVAATAADTEPVIELPGDPVPAADAPPRDAVDHVLQALIGRAQDRQVALTQVAAELVEQANLEDREIDEVLGDLIDLADEDETVESGERLDELTMFNEAVPKRPGQLTDFARLDAREKKRVIIRVLCLLVALQEDYKLQPNEPASEAETRSWPLARAVWPVKAKSEDEDETNLPGRRRKSKFATR